MRLPRFRACIAQRAKMGTITCVWGAALIFTGLAASAAKDMARATHAASMPAAPTFVQSVRLEKVPVSRAELARAIEIVKAGRPQVRIVLEGAADAPVVSVAADRLEYSDLWRSALLEIQAAVPGGDWSFIQLCAGRDCPQVPLSASLTVVRNRPLTS